VRNGRFFAAGARVVSHRTGAPRAFVRTLPG
jgi:hypothetical protein